MKVIIRLIIIAESEMLDDIDGRQGWQQIQRWRCRAIETSAAEIWQRGETMEKTKEMQDDEGGGG